MAGAASQAGDADSSPAPGLASGLQESVNVHRGALLLVPQCTSSFVLYILCILHTHAQMEPQRIYYIPFARHCAGMIQS